MKAYLDLITSQHREQPAFMALLRALLTPLADVQNLLLQWETLLNLETAEGAALDQLGARIACSRRLDFQPASGSAVLADGDYRLLIKAKILANHWDGTIQGMQENFRLLFPEYFLSVIDHQDMTLRVTVVGLKGTLYEELLERGYIIPKPAGVRMIVNVVEDKIFAFDLQNESFGGYDEGAWY